MSHDLRRPRTLCAAALALSLSCSDRPLDETTGESASTSSSTSTSSTSSGTATPTTGDDPPSTGTGPSTSSPSTSGSDSGESGVGSSTGGPPDPVEGCDIWAQDCAEGQKCMPVDLDDQPGLEAARCVPIVVEPHQLDARCEVLGGSGDGLDTCARGQVCYRIDWASKHGVCIALCGGSKDSPLCPAPDIACELDALGVENLCFRRCDPLAQDCPGTNVCVTRPSVDVEFICVQDESGDGGQVFDPCSWINTCDKGLFCGFADMVLECDGGSEGCCTPYCDITADPNPCPGQGQECSPWYPPSEAVPGLEDVGSCVIPPF